MMILDLYHCLIYPSCYVFCLSVIILLFRHLFEVVQTFFFADGFDLLLVQLQHERFVVDGGAAVLTDGRVVPAEIFQARVAAKLVDSLAQGQLTCGLEKKMMIKER